MISSIGIVRLFKAFSNSASALGKSTESIAME
jgi:hypothetical protein